MSKIDNSASGVVREALRQMEERDSIKAEIRSKIGAGLASARAGRVEDGDAFFLKWKRSLMRKSWLMTTIFSYLGDHRFAGAVGLNGSALLRTVGG